MASTSSTESPNAGDRVSEPVNEEEYLKYLFASNVNVSNFVSVKLLDKSNYTIWRKQMLYLLDSQNLRCFVDFTVYLPPEIKSPNIIRQYERLVEGWIYGTLNERMLKFLVYVAGPGYIWSALEIICDPQKAPTESAGSSSTRLPISDSGISRDELRYMYASNVDVYTNFVSEGLRTESSYTTWRKQMLCLLDSENLRGFVDGDPPEFGSFDIEEKYESLVHDWIFPSLNETMKRKLEHLAYPGSIWRKLERIHDHKANDFREDIASTLVNTFPRVAMQDDRLLMAMARTFPSDLSFGEALICPSLKSFHQRIVKRSCSLLNAPRVLYAWAYHVLWATRSLKEAMLLLQQTVLILLVVPAAVLYPLYQLIHLLILVILYPFFMLYFLLWTILAIGVMPIKRIETKRKKYQEAKDLVKIICNHIDDLGPFEVDHPCYSEPFMEAVRQGAYEVIDEILYRLPNFIHHSMETFQTFVELAIKNRSHKIYNLIYHSNVRKEEYRTFEDFFGNNILHLAGRLAPTHILSRTTGAALQLQRELQWFQEVEKLMLPTDLVKKNADMETPQMVFTREHTDLVKEGEEWMKTTSEACSITAALIVTIVFAAAITVPGGNVQETGIPLFKKEIAFIIFAVCDATSLFLAASALLVFLSILTTRFAEKDFLVSLPRRLIIDLCAFFLSTASMLVAFSAILFLVFCDQRPWMLAPIGGLTCIPIAVIVTLQLPLLFDLFTSTYISIFGKQKYIAGGKFMSKYIPPVVT